MRRKASGRSIGAAMAASLVQHTNTMIGMQPRRMGAKAANRPHTAPVLPNPRTVGRNDPCPCEENMGKINPHTGKPVGGREVKKKFKHCCMPKGVRTFRWTGVDQAKAGSERHVEAVVDYSDSPIKIHAITITPKEPTGGENSTAANLDGTETLS